MDQVQDSDRQALKEGIRHLAAQMECVYEFQEFLSEFQALLSGAKEYAPQKTVHIEPDALVYPIKAYKELVIIRLEKQETIALILDAFHSLLQAYFPECLIDSPFRLSVSLSNIKYPYHEHWRFFEESQRPGVIFHMQQPGIRQVRLTAQQFVALKQKLKGYRVNHLLHRLAIIEAEAGELTAMIQALEQRHRFPELQELIWQYKLSLREILDFYCLVGVTDEEAVA